RAPERQPGAGAPGAAAAGGRVRAGGGAETPPQPPGSGGPPGGATGGRGGFVGGRPPAVAPGDYRVVLVVDGQEFAQSLRVEADPTVPNSDVIAGEEEIDQSDEDEAEPGDQ